VKAIIVIPAYNESKVIYQVIKSLPKKLKNIKSFNLVLINDGSTDSTVEEANKSGIKIISHIKNRGLGAAIKTGLEYAKIKKSDITVTFDGDGQHDSKDIQKLINPIIKKDADLVIGSRFIKSQKLPTDRLVINKIANFITTILFGVKSTDSQSGLRAFSKKALNLIEINSDRMEFSSEILMESRKNNLKMVEIPIKAIYTEYSREKGQKNTNAFPIISRLVIKLLR